MTDTLGRCKDCRWWGLLPDEAAHSMKLEIRKCDHSRLHPKRDSSAPFLVCGPNFGCVHFEKREVGK